MRTGLEPCTPQYGLTAAGRGYDHVGPAHRLFESGGPRIVERRKALGVCRSTAPDSHLLEVAYLAQCLKVCACLHAATEQSEHPDRLARQVTGHRRRHCGGAHLRDPPAVEDCERLASRAVE